MPLSVIERGFSCLFTLDTFQLRITFALTAGFLKICGSIRSILLVEMAIQRATC